MLKLDFFHNRPPFGQSRFFTQLSNGY